MLAIPKHPKRRGDWVELQFMIRAALLGLNVCKPWGESTRYDFAIEHAAGFCRVQVKSTTYSQRNSWACKLPKHAYMLDDFDYLVVYVIPEDIWYIIPCAAVGGRTGIALLNRRQAKGKYQQYLEAWHLLNKAGV